MTKRKSPRSREKAPLNDEQMRQLKTFTALSQSLNLKQRTTDNPFVSDRVKSVPGKQRVGQVTVDDEAIGLLFEGLDADPDGLTRMTLDDLL
ncbi:MAG: hypothetical protein AB7P76_11595 [Candidatus Melainabacteria bacterium]